MAGTVITILEKTELDFGNIPGALAAGPKTYLAQDIDISRYREITMLIRIHANAISGTGTMTFKLESVLPSPEEPNVYFRDATAVASQAIVAGDAAPKLFRVTVAGNAGAMASLSVGPSCGAAAVIKATVSVVLSLKE